MDPITQGALGAAAACAAVQHRAGRRTWLYGALGGMAADLDILIRSPSDPLVGLEFHRHFTHSLAFVPVGGLLVAAPWLVSAWRKRSRGDLAAWSRAQWIAAATTIGYATHGLLDAFTSYGTLLWWPFSNARVSWNAISIIDPAYTVPLLIAAFVAARKQRRRFALIGLIAANAYLGLCGLQALRAAGAQQRIAAERGHVIEDSMVFPGIGTNLMWRSVYLHRERVHVDRITAPWWGTTRILPKGSHAIAPPQPPREWTEQRRAYELFHWFSRGWMTLPGRGEYGPKVCDLRFSLMSSKEIPLFCLEIDDATGAVRHERASRDAAAALSDRLGPQPDEREI